MQTGSARLPRRRHALRGRRRLCVPTALLLLATNPALAQAPPGYTVSDRGDLTVEHVATSAGTAERVVRLFGAARADVEARLGVALPRRPHVVVAPTHQAFEARFRAQAGHPPGKTVLAVAFPGKALVIIRAAGIREGTDAGLDRTLRHELGHLALGAVEQARGKRLPRWLNEGLCEWAAGRRPSLQERSQLNGWAKFFQLPRLEDLTDRFPDHGNASARTYLVACGFLVFLESKGEPRALVSALRRTPDVDAAFTEVFGAPVDDLEAEWKMGLADQHSFLTTIATSFTAWSVAALLAILAGLRAYWKRRVLMRKLAEEERLEDERAAALAEATDDVPPSGPSREPPLP